MSTPTEPTPVVDPIQTQVTTTTTDENGNTVITGYAPSEVAVYEGTADNSGTTTVVVAPDPNVSEGA